MVKKLNPMPENMIYALDIGTRNVVGVIAKNTEAGFHILAHHHVPHPERAMYDGQIHDIEKVTKVVKQVTQALSEETGFELKKVAIAAAGRALKTQRVTVGKAIDSTEEIDQIQLEALEIEGIQTAQMTLEDQGDQTVKSYYCVGYTVIHYTLDGAIMQNPLSHRGSHIGAEIIATFLPHSVVDSLYTVVDKMGLEVINLTLEPIAAINIAIPEKFRLLNLALVDIGAGTSDIALTKAGAIFSYAMVDIAGDELTEALVQKYLLDFDTAENLKVGLNQKETIAFSDIVGIPYEVASADVVAAIADDIDRVSQQIAKKIMEANDGSPSAVFLIGGGCQVPGFKAALSGHLNLQPERVVIKGAEQLENVSYEYDAFKGPEFITPLGIGLTALKDREHDFLQLHVNDSPLRLFNSKQLFISDALVLIGYNARKLLPERGKSITYHLNDKQKRLIGGYGEAAKVFLNGSPASLDTPIKNKDFITIEPAIKGEDAKASLADVVDFNKRVYFNEEQVYLVQGVKAGDQELRPDDTLIGGMVIEATMLENVSDFMAFKGLSDLEALRINGRQVGPTVQLKHGDYITYQSQIAPSQVADKEAPSASDESKASLSLNRYDLLINGAMTTIETDKSSLIFVDVFEHIDFDLSKPQGIIDLSLNGQRARYTDYLKSGDVLTIEWKK